MTTYPGASVLINSLKFILLMRSTFLFILAWYVKKLKKHVVISLVGSTIHYESLSFSFSAYYDMIDLGSVAYNFAFSSHAVQMKCISQMYKYSITTAAEITRMIIVNVILNLKTL